MKRIQLAILSVSISQVIPLIGKTELILDYKNIVLIVANISLWLFQPAISIQETKEHKSFDRYSVILIISMSMLSTIVPIIDWAYFSNPYVSNPVANIAGFIILWSGVLLRNYSIKILGRHFTATVQLQKGHQLITKGPYGIIRHPSYLGALIAMVGSAIFLNSFIGIVTAVVAMMVAYVIRINAEEKMLLNSFGTLYREYQKHTKKLIPYIW